MNRFVLVNVLLLLCYCYVQCYFVLLCLQKKDAPLQGADTWEGGSGRESGGVIGPAFVQFGHQSILCVVDNLKKKTLKLLCLVCSSEHVLVFVKFIISFMWFGLLAFHMPVYIQGAPKNVLIEQNHNQNWVLGLNFTMNMSWEGLIRLSLSKKRPKN